MSSSPLLSIAILTLNEESDLPACLASLAWCDDVHVVDSGSTDRTVAIAQAHGAQVHHHPFTAFGQQRNWTLEQAGFSRPWVLFLDADECSTPVFRRAVEEAIASAPEEVAGFYCCWKLVLCGQWLRRCDNFPKWQFRLLRRGRALFTDYGHGQKEGEVQGRLEYLREPYLHFAFSKGWGPWMQRHNKYSDLEARERLAWPARWQEMFSRHGSVRNRALKPMVSRLPGWPLAIFLFRYVVKGGFLEGLPGLIYCVNMSFYEYLIRLKLRDLQTGGAGAAARQPPGPYWLRFWLRLGITAGALCVLVFALEPTYHSNRLHELPRPLARWLNDHDNLCNFGFFGCFTLLLLLLPRGQPGTGEKQTFPAEVPWGSVAGMVGLVCLLEFVQLFIPGRVASLVDVATGSAGVLLAGGIFTAWQWSRGEKRSHR